jgi:N-methylhydantoinase A
MSGALSNKTARIGIDIGGTFTDIVHRDLSGAVRHEKVLTTPQDITNGIIAAVDKVGADLGAMGFFLHGTTVALNALLEGKTPRVGLITTVGFGDILEIMRTNRPDMYNLQQVKPTPLVPRRWRREISARVDASGQVLRPVDEGEIRALAREFDDAGIRAIAVCLLHSYVDPEPERRVRELLRDERPGLWVSISSDLSREWREFERTSTTVINAATAPIVDSYLRRLEERLASRSFSRELLIMQSNGGVMVASDARVRPVSTLMSGPVGGVAGAEAIARKLGSEENLVTLDIGGTSADVAIIDRGRAVHTPVSHLDRWPILTPMIEIRSIGAGGGSMATVDEHGGLRVGPESAGASPGPACYGLGGKRATVTDANLVLGRIDGSRFLGGDFPLDFEAARAGVERDVAASYGMTAEEAAEGILTVVNSNMSRLLREVLVQRGYDPRHFTLLAFGGGGGLHACAVADEAGLSRVLVPPHPGTLSAHGIYAADVRHDHHTMFIRRIADVSDGELDAAFRELESEALPWVRFGEARRQETIRSAELRYVGQEYTLAVDVASDGALSVEQCMECFHAEHRRLYGFARGGLGVEFVKLMISVLVHTRPPESDSDGRAAIATKAERPPWRSDLSRIVWEGKQSREAVVYERSSLGSGEILPGPCVVEEPGATTYVATAWVAEVDAFENLVLRKTGE